MDLLFCLSMTNHRIPLKFAMLNVFTYQDWALLHNLCFNKCWFHFLILVYKKTVQLLAITIPVAMLPSCAWNCDWWLIIWLGFKVGSKIWMSGLAPGVMNMSQVCGWLVVIMWYCGVAGGARAHRVCWPLDVVIWLVDIGCDEVVQLGWKAW